MRPPGGRNLSPSMVCLVASSCFVKVSFASIISSRNLPVPRVFCQNPKGFTSCCVATAVAEAPNTHAQAQTARAARTPPLLIVFVLRFKSVPPRDDRGILTAAPLSMSARAPS